ncbi:acetyltransferase, ribosomal protein N-acetylase [Halovivax ruber XH-70]|uniref:Acetyltransferase, ribosomal protein N-acetylase n=1 Tax=Halovivax ruber (strain DSM 18193 / JCM 13892 / XH-70) TaxID=797302 RepID=L0IHG9_HALRX|nr:GNAT family protein [Halovivax ruber]AGB17412.1 acetyltransferase, ribosomal protein N-acetylase [Halovivax ruber XH-70]
MFPETVATDRLRLERFCHETVDVRELYECFAVGYGEGVDEVFEHVPQSPYRTLKDAQEMIDDAERRWAETEGAEYVVRPKAGEDSAGKLAGLTTLSCEWDRRTGRLGLILGKPFWGRGYSGERAAALMELAFDRLDLELVTAGHNDGNEKSKRAIQRYIEAHGGQYDGVLRNWVPMDDEVADLHRYTVTREQYDAAVDRGPT